MLWSLSSFPLQTFRWCIYVYVIFARISVNLCSTSAPVHQLRRGHKNARLQRLVNDVRQTQCVRDNRAEATILRSTRALTFLSESATVSGFNAFRWSVERKKGEILFGEHDQSSDTIDSLLYPQFCVCLVSSRVFCALCVWRELDFPIRILVRIRYHTSYTVITSFPLLSSHQPPTKHLRVPPKTPLMRE